MPLLRWLLSADGWAQDIEAELRSVSVCIYAKLVESQRVYVGVSCSPTAVQTYPNEVFFPYSNGGLDPWSAGGVTQNITDSLVAIMIPDGAHHLDLRSRNPGDPRSVQQARALEICYMKQWIEKARHRHWSGTATTVATIPPLAWLGAGPGLADDLAGHLHISLVPRLCCSANHCLCPWEKQAAGGWRAFSDNKL